MDAVTLLGLMAGALTTMSLVPQLLKLHRTRSSKAISLTMFSLFSIGVAMWLIYGILQRDAAIIAANATTLMLAVAIVSLAIKYRK